MYKLLKLIVDLASKFMLTNMTSYPPAVMKLQLIIDREAVYYNKSVYPQSQQLVSGIVFT